jgi:hypothetical protein
MATTAGLIRDHLKQLPIPAALSVMVLDEQIMFDPAGRLVNLFQQDMAAIHISADGGTVACVRPCRLWEEASTSDVAHLVDECVTDGLALSRALGREVWV